MTTLESRLEDYRQQIERLENAVARKDRQIDELLERLEPGPESEPEERVSTFPWSAPRCAGWMRCLPRARSQRRGKWQVRKPRPS